MKMKIVLTVLVLAGTAASLPRGGLILEKTYDTHAELGLKPLKVSRKLNQNKTNIQTSVSISSGNGTSGSKFEGTPDVVHSQDNIEGYPDNAGSSLATQFLRPYLDFTDDLREIVKRVLMMRRKLMESKEQYAEDNAASIFLGHSYKQYDEHSYLGRQGYTGSSRNPRNLLMNNDDLNNDFGGLDFRGIKSQLDQFDYLGGKRMNREEMLDKLFGSRC